MLRTIRVGWIVSEKYFSWRVLLSRWFYFCGLDFLPSSTKMRVVTISRWINKNCNFIYCELYDPRKHYDIVVVFKTVTSVIQQEVTRLRENNVKLIYDANVNYWEVSGEYSASSPKPTFAQQRGILNLMKNVDVIVADSSYLANVAKKYHHHVVHIPDNVDLNVYSKRRKHQKGTRLRVVWSGMSHKAEHLKIIIPVLDSLREKIDVYIVSEKRPSLLDEFSECRHYHYVHFSDRQYAKLLSSCDVIVSPKYLLNAYDLGHTEYKITLGMAVGLPAIASPQQSYIEAITDKNSGYIVNTTDEWFSAFQSLISDIELRRDMGERAYQTVIEKYATPVIAKAYLDLFFELAGI